MFSEVSQGLISSPPVQCGTAGVHLCTCAMTPPRCRGRYLPAAVPAAFSSLGRAVAVARWQRLRRGVGRQKQTAVQVAILRDCHPPMPAERRSGGATVCQDCHVSACSESDRLWPACQRLPDRDHHQRWRVVGLPHRSQGVCRVEKRTPPGKLPVNLLLLLLSPFPPSPFPVARSPFSSPYPTLLRAACRQSTQASSSGGNSSMPALPLAWNLANRSPNVDPSHTRSRRGPSPAAGSHLPSSLIASHRVQACRRARGAPSHRSKRFLFSLGHPAPPPAGLFRGIRCKQPGSSRQS